MMTKNASTLNHIAKPKLTDFFQLQWQDAQSNYVLTNNEKGVIKLNRSAAEILKLCNGLRDIPAITRELERTFSISGLQHDVDDILRVACERQLVC